MILALYCGTKQMKQSRSVYHHCQRFTKPSEILIWWDSITLKEENISVGATPSEILVLWKDQEIVISDTLWIRNEDDVAQEAKTLSSIVTFINTQARDYLLLKENSRRYIGSTLEFPSAL